MKLKELMAGVSKKLGVEIPVENNVCMMEADGIAISLLQVDEVASILITAEIGAAPERGLENLLSAMLSANHHFIGTAGATISRDPKTGRFHLCRVEHCANLSVDRLLAVLESFINTLETWQAVLVQYENTGAVDAGTPEDTEIRTMGNNFLRI